MRDPRRLTGLPLIAGGLLWALVATTDQDATVLVPGVGVAFVAAQGGPDEAVVLGLGIGFVAISVIDGLLSDDGAAWWPLIPGGILTVVGASQIAGIRDIGIYLVPGALMIVGVALVVRPSRDP